MLSTSLIISRSSFASVNTSSICCSSLGLAIFTTSSSTNLSSSSDVMLITDSFNLLSSTKSSVAIASSSSSPNNSFILSATEKCELYFCILSSSLSISNKLSLVLDKSFSIGKVSTILDGSSALT